VDGNGNCQTDNSLCSGGECTTGLQQFLNGQNECNTLEDDGLNNNCGNTTLNIGVDPTNSGSNPFNILSQRIDWFNTIGCTGGFAETNPIPPPSPSPS
jgi:hypothetical protein